MKSLNSSIQRSNPRHVLPQLIAVVFATVLSGAVLAQDAGSSVASRSAVENKARPKADNAATAQDGSALGHGNTASGAGSNAVGYGNQAEGKISNAFGSGSVAQGVASNAFGTAARAMATGSLALGTAAQANVMGGWRSVLGRWRTEQRAFRAMIRLPVA